LFVIATITDNINSMFPLDLFFRLSELLGFSLYELDIIMIDILKDAHQIHDIFETLR